MYNYIRSLFMSFPTFNPTRVEKKKGKYNSSLSGELQGYVYCTTFNLCLIAGPKRGNVHWSNYIGHRQFSLFFLSFHFADISHIDQDEEKKRMEKWQSPLNQNVKKRKKKEKRK